MMGRMPAVLEQSGCFDKPHLNGSYIFSNRHAFGQSQEYPGHLRADLRVMVTKTNDAADSIETNSGNGTNGPVLPSKKIRQGWMGRERPVDRFD